MRNNRIRELTLISLLSVIIAISGIIKLPGLIPGTEFQMSAPIAIGICATFGFKRYIFSGIIASCINLLMGTHTILNVIVAMIFRLVGGGLIGIFGNGIIVVTTAGPVGTIFGRVVMSFITGVPVKALIISAFIGMLYTAMLSYITFKLIKRITIKTPYKNFILDEYKIGESIKNETL
ncbi:MAG: hypothetical protein KH369_11520 [Paraclostridium bifermentans]|uniref:hypothetical protein n=1 Tax=Paraclostridium bifermentans TaxID=1490 RepID=UPI0011DCC402|nr:hypothetical protein [Paraclostridium bifermentans]MBS6508817.1 hypothetical protein [Paraclostridium bifermentans]